MSRTRKADQRFILPEVVDPPRKCLRIYIPEDENHQRAFWAAVLELTNAWAWEWDGNKTGSLAGYVWHEIVQDASERFAFDNGGCFMFLLRQSPDNPCVLEQSVDEGENWTTAFNFGLCISGGTKTILNINIKNDIDILIQNWEDNSEDITLIFVNIEYDGTGVDADRDRALCYALTSYIQLVCEAAASALSDGNFITDALTWVVNTADVIFSVVATFLPFGNELAWAVSQIADSIVGAIQGGSDAEDFRDIAAQNEVLCCMYDNLSAQPSGESVQFTDWQDALDGCSFTGNADKIYDIIAATLSDISSYLTLMQLWSVGVTLQLADVDLDCYCTDGWTQEFLDGNGNTGLSIVEFADCTGSFVGTKAEGCCPGSITGELLRIETDPQLRTITYVSFDFEYNKTRAGTDPVQIYINDVLIAQTNLTTITSGTGNLNTGVVFIPDCDVIRMEGSARTNLCSDGGYFNITAITIEGQGTNPY